MQAWSLEPTDPRWPPGLDDLMPHAPARLRVRGAVPPHGALAIAVVGTRHPSAEGLALTRWLVEDLVAAGVVIWSGGAVGIDAAAHQAALEAGGATVAVLGSGLDQSFPPQNAGLFRDIVEGGVGAVVSCIDDDVCSDRHHFRHRNGVLAACTRALVIVECGFSSGARNAAAHARRLDRPVGVVPFTPRSGLGIGNAHELTEARAWPVFSAQQVLNLAQRGTTATDPAARKAKGDGEPGPRPEPADPIEREVLAHLRGTPSHLDALCSATGHGAAVVGRAVFALAVEGMVVERTPGIWGVA